MALLQLRARWSDAVHSPRVWALLAMLFTRGAGFLASFSLSRLVGAEALSLYISTVITASVVATPIAQVVFNAATMGSAAAPSKSWLRQLLWANLGLTFVLIGPMCVAFYWMHWDIANGLSDHLHVSHVWLALAGLSAVAGQVFIGVLGGMLNGMGAQLPSARSTALLAVLILCLSYPAVASVGVAGAWVVLMLGSWLPVICQFVLFQRFLEVQWTPKVVGGHFSHQPLHASQPLHAVRRHFIEGLPNALTLMLSGSVSWFCSIYLVNHYLGAASVAVLAVANQWMTLMLLPATSWGGVMLGELAHARVTRESPQVVWTLIRRLLRRNLLVTLCLVFVVLVGAPWLQQAYRLEGRGLPVLLAVSGAIALSGAAFGVFERVFVCWNRQIYLIGFAAVGLSVQVLFTYVLVQRSLVFVQVGALLAAVLILGLGTWQVAALLRRDQVGAA